MGEVVARAVRNSVGFDFQPRSGDPWFTDNGRDWLGDDQPPDELNQLSRPGEHFWFPYCHGEALRDPERGAARECGQFTPTARALGPHVAALGMRFYTGRMFPEAYRGGIFIAEHGSWNRSKPIGYRVMFVEGRGRSRGVLRGIRDRLAQGQHDQRPSRSPDQPDGPPHGAPRSELIGAFAAFPSTRR